MNKEIVKNKRFPVNERIDALLFVLTNTNFGVFDLSSDAKANRLMNRYTAEVCTMKYNKMREVIKDAQTAYGLYTSAKLMEFFTNDEVINHILNSEKYSNIKVSFSKKFVNGLQSKEWKKIEYVPEKNEENERMMKLEREYKNFPLECPVFYKIRKYNPKNRFDLGETTFLIYDAANPKNLNVIIEFPTNSKMPDPAHYIKMCKVHWCKENKFNLNEKLKDARVISTANFNKE